MFKRSDKRLIKPSALGLALYVPIPLVIGGAAATLALAYMAVGIDPTEMITLFVRDSAMATLPLALNLLVVWALYYLLFTIATCTVYTFLTSTRNTEPYIDSLVVGSCPVLNRHSLIRLLSRLTGGLPIASRCRGLPDHLATGWHASTHPQVE